MTSRRGCNIALRKLLAMYSVHMAKERFITLFNTIEPPRTTYQSKLRKVHFTQSLSNLTWKWWRKGSYASGRIMFFANLTILTPYRENAVIAAYNCYSYTKKYSTFKQFMTSVTVTVKTDSARCFCFTFRLMEFHANATKQKSEGFDSRQPCRR